MTEKIDVLRTRCFKSLKYGGILFAIWIPLSFAVVMTLKKGIPQIIGNIVTVLFGLVFAASAGLLFTGIFFSAMVGVERYKIMKAKKSS